MLFYNMAERCSPVKLPIQIETSCAKQSHCDCESQNQVQSSCDTSCSLYLDRTINILSSSVLVPLDKFSVYGSTKKALQFWQKTQDKQTIVIPSGINTKLYRTTSNHLRSHGLLEPDLVAKKILKGLLKNKSKINVGIIVHATRLLIHVVPEKLLIKFFRILSNRFK
jgi:hypothetical protein